MMLNNRAGGEPVNTMNDIFKKIGDCFSSMLALTREDMTDATHPLRLARSYEDACLEVYDGMCIRDRLSTAFALDRYIAATDAIENMPEPDRTELRGLIADRDVVPGSVEVAVCALLDDVRSIPSAVTAGAMRAEYGSAGDHPASIRRIECALSLIEMAATRRPAVKVAARVKVHVKAA